MDEVESNCIICKAATEEDLSCVQKRGALTLINSADRKNDEGLKKIIERRLGLEILGLYVHASCRRRYNDFRNITNENTIPPLKKAKMTRSTTSDFEWKSTCFFCADGVKLRDKGSFRTVQTLEMHGKVLDICKEEGVKEMGGGHKFNKVEIRHRMLSCIDLIAAEAVYHKNCHKEFFKVKMEMKSQSKADIKLNTFDDLCETLEFLTEPITISELRKLAT